jgi:DNA-binding XRE family transcriptional regulator
LSSALENISSLVYNPTMLTPDQIRAARAILGLNQAALAKLAGLSATALNSIEGGQSDPKMSTIEAIRRALEANGARFENGMVGLRPFRIGDKVKYRQGKAPADDPMSWHVSGQIVDIQTTPAPGSAPQVRVLFPARETDWTQGEHFEFAMPPEPGFQTHIRA